MFWGGERLKTDLRKLVSDFDASRIDHASYRLRIGPEVFVSPTGTSDDPRNKPKKQLSPDEGFVIPAGQFGFILTEETVKVPEGALAFISMRAGYKFRGLVNVSGFHVDPGYDGRLVFAVFNAGPGPVHLSRGEACFLIWYADLDRPSKAETKKGFATIPSDLIQPMAQEVQSFAGLLSKINDNEKKASDRIVSVEREQAVLKWAMAIAVGAIVTFGLRDCAARNEVKPIAAESSAQATQSTQPSSTEH